MCPIFTCSMLTPKSVDVVIAVTFGVMISMYKLRPLLLEITEKEKTQIQARKSARNPND